VGPHLAGDFICRRLRASLLPPPPQVFFICAIAVLAILIDAGLVHSRPKRRFLLFQAASWCRLVCRVGCLER
jgi:hypothetical protein